MNSVRCLWNSSFAILLLPGLLSVQGLTAQDRQVDKRGASSGTALTSQSLQNTSHLNQSVSLSLKNATIRQALEQIRERTHIEFTYSDDLLPLERVTFLKESIPVGKALDALLEVWPKSV